MTPASLSLSSLASLKQPGAAATTAAAAAAASSRSFAAAPTHPATPPPCAAAAPAAFDHGAAGTKWIRAEWSGVHSLTPSGRPTDIP